GKRMDIGISGEKTDQGYFLTLVEPRADSYAKGLRENDLVLAFNGTQVQDMTQEDIDRAVNPLEGNATQITFLSHLSQEEKTVQVETKEYFKKLIFELPTKVKGIYALELRRFNRKTAEDMLRYLEYFRSQSEIKGLILDLRGNPGGPPLAAREISSFFLPPGDDFAYFQKKGMPKAMLDVPEIPKKFHYDGPMVILINEKSGSASELFSGVLQRRGRAVLLGENSAGQVMLKSMFHFEDESMVLLITSRGHHPDGAVFSFNGLTPNKKISPEDDESILDLATNYLVYVNKNPEYIKN
ncbi:MAG: hypothetical protein KC713_05950, partial [Candidatus Omnitrophica bacterium]|nr:hypothetical protein [Candidatus Omnitrophota bacterium]